MIHLHFFDTCESVAIYFRTLELLDDHVAQTLEYTKNIIAPAHNQYFEAFLSIRSLVPTLCIVSSVSVFSTNTWASFYAYQNPNTHPPPHS